MKKDQYILEQMQGYIIDHGLAYYLHDEDSDPPLEGQPVLSMCDFEILCTKEYVAEIANIRAGTREAYDRYEVTDICKQLAQYGWIYFAKQIGMFSKAKDFSITVWDHLGTDISENEKYWEYDPEWAQSNRYWQDLEEVEEDEFTDKKGFFHATT